jgi:Cu(I)/Ag(I) efflux system protein CusF
MNRLTRICAALALALSAAGPAIAQSSGHAHGDMNDGAKSAPATHRASGVVKAVNADKGTVTIAHGPVATLKWPSMTMGFTTDDRKLLQNLQPGAKVEFEFFQQGSRYVITSIK